MSQQSGYPGAPPGWYPDPAGGPGQRWWDGYAWSESVVLPQQPPAPPWSSAPPPQGSPYVETPWSAASQRLQAYNTSGLIGGELSMVPAARISMGVPALTGLLTLIVVRTQSAQMLTFGNYIKLAYDDASRGLPAPNQTNVSFSPWFVVLGLITIAALVVTLVWQHRAASAARALGYPSDFSPAWGVGSWFVPVVNCWFPYQAIRNCLPAGDPQRRLVLEWWLAYIVGGTLGCGAYIAAFFSTGVALGLSIPAALAYIAVLANAPRVVMAIASVHRQALAQ